MSPAEIARLTELAEGKTVLEVGSWLGASTVAMAEKATRVHAVDWHRGDPHAGVDESAERFLANLAANGVRDKVVTHIGRSEVILPMFRDGLFTFAFHDAFHTTDAVAADLAAMWPLMARGSLVAIHDYGRFGVKEAVDAFGPLVELTETLAVVQA